MNNKSNHRTLAFPFFNLSMQEKNKCQVDFLKFYSLYINNSKTSFIEFVDKRYKTCKNL